MSKKILVTGAGGMVGHYVNTVFSEYDIVLTDIHGDYKKLDVRDMVKTRDMILKIKPDIVLHLAAVTDVDKCEQEETLAYSCNKDATRNVALGCKESGSVMIYISSGSVFSGKLGRPARESDDPDPVNIYGKSKLAGEKEVISNLSKYYIARAGWMIGGGADKDKKFVGKIMKKIISGEKRLRVTDDKFGSPVFAKNLLEAVRCLLSTEKFDIYHVANGTGCSRHDIAVAIKDILKMDDLVIERDSTSSFNLVAPRSYSEELENFNLKRLGLDFTTTWKGALKEYIKAEWNL